MKLLGLIIAAAAAQARCRRAEVAYRSGLGSYRLLSDARRELVEACRELALASIGARAGRVEA